MPQYTCETTRRDTSLRISVYVKVGSICEYLPVQVKLTSKSPWNSINHIVKTDQQLKILNLKDWADLEEELFPEYTFHWPDLSCRVVVWESINGSELWIAFSHEKEKWSWRFIGILHSTIQQEPIPIGYLSLMKTELSYIIFIVSSDDFVSC